MGKVPSREDVFVSNISPNSGEMTLKELIMSSASMLKYVRSKWLFIVLFMVLGAAIGFLIALPKKSLYKAELTFVLESGRQNSMAGYAGMASQFGLDLGECWGSL